MVTERILPDESYYRTTETERLAPVAVAPYLPENPRPLIGLALIVLGLVAAGIAWRTAIFSAGFSAGWAAGHAAGVVQPWVDARGWVALLVFSIAGTSFMIWRQNKIDATCTPPRGY